jgi:hypothetical protein
MESKNPGQVDRTRRQFLIAARGAGALGAIAVLFGKSVPVQAAPVQQATQESSPGGGYHETEHIREYYRSARYW